MKYEITTSGNRTVVNIHGELTLTDRGAFETLIPKVVGGGTDAIVLNLKSLAFMDSAGLGMLITLRERAGGGNKVILSGPTGDVKELLELACFNTLFAFE